MVYSAASGSSARRFFILTEKLQLVGGDFYFLNDMWTGKENTNIDSVNKVYFDNSEINVWHMTTVTSIAIYTISRKSTSLQINPYSRGNYIDGNAILQ